MDRTPATSIFELLTAENPALNHEGSDNDSLTSSKKYHSPTEVRRWEEFNFETLEAVFDRQLMLEALRERPPIQYPIMFKHELSVTDEDATREILHQWNKYIVNRALYLVEDKFQPSLWCSKKRKHGSQEMETKPARKGKRKSLSRECKQRAKKPKTQHRRHLRPDSGAVGSGSTPEVGTVSGILTLSERFPKEYKPATKWRSIDVLKRPLINSKGEWQQDVENTKRAMPIRQAFSYCIAHGCRYGCILTGEEAFIFRIKPRSRPKSKPIGALTPRLQKLMKVARNADDGGKALRQRLVADGLLEYVSIPWGNHHQGDLSKYRTLTVNLALWFVHILAGKNYQSDWIYEDLKDESLPVPEQLKLGSTAGDEPEEESYDSDATEPFQTANSMKEQTEQVDEDENEEEDEGEEEQQVEGEKDDTSEEEDEEDLPLTSFSSQFSARTLRNR